ncbi:O-methyltransferase [Ancylobacter mangrovi]|uniref:O-methyltransferase n=1 Tax=Ancylobacter mangrovi TaxID=2972472 RepID=UPI0021622A71|nr:O-methyltransferase [Ancylobacter mangrovi]MCS0503197.1 O-methyltransferase [Ancylobacter mangrovi]
MTTLTTAPVAPLIAELFAQAENAWSATPSVATYWSALTVPERDRLMRSTTDYADLYARLKDLPLAVSPQTGTLLYMLARATRARSIVEFGTSFGVSTLHLAAALRDNGGGRLITSEFEPSKVARARANLAAGGLDDLVEFRPGDALETLAVDLPESVDLLLLDGAKGLYAAVLELVEDRLRPGALVVADNADFCPDYLERVRSPEQGYLSVPFGGDVEVSMRIA